MHDKQLSQAFEKLLQTMKDKQVAQSMVLEMQRLLDAVKDQEERLHFAEAVCFQVRNDDSVSSPLASLGMLWERIRDRQRTDNK